MKAFHLATCHPNNDDAPAGLGCVASCPRRQATIIDTVHHYVQDILDDESPRTPPVIAARRLIAEDLLRILFGGNLL